MMYPSLDQLSLCHYYFVPNSSSQYVDENYSGGGIGEYSIFDTSKGYYDSTACNKHGNGNCKLMDCHDPYTQNWKLIGVFKEASFFGGDAFFEQLFKHEGTCLWNDEDTYEYMNTARQSWTSGCLSTGIQTGTKNQYGDDNLYIDLKPTYNGNMTYALYTDYVCSVEYEGYKYNVDAVAAKMGLLYGSYMQQWNDAMEVFKVCQPCRAYNLQTSSSSSSKYSSSSSWKKKYYNNRDLSSADEESERELGNNNNNGYSANSGWYADDDDSYDPNEGYFRCDDEADYSNVNQCMKFRSHGDLEAASWEDLVAATNQGGILQVSVNGIIYGSPFVSKEQDQYLTYVRRQKEAAYEQELQNKANKLIREAPTGENMFVIGLLWIGLGGLTLLLSTCRFVRQCRSWREIRSLSEPLHTEVIIVR